jgi:hypothetical protein
MVDKLISPQSKRLTLHCPGSCQSVRADKKKQISVPGGQATWWHCPECLGWHVSIREGDEMATIQMADTLDLGVYSG